MKWWLLKQLVMVCQSDNSTAVVMNQKCRSQYLFTYFSLQTTMRDTSLSLLSLLLTIYCRLMYSSIHVQALTFHTSYDIGIVLVPTHSCDAVASVILLPLAEIIRLIVTARLDLGYPRRNSTAACVHHGAISIVSSRWPHPQWVQPSW
jgi:hypothetical protein